jgi:hypothetical protein
VIWLSDECLPDRAVILAQSLAAILHLNRVVVVECISGVSTVAVLLKRSLESRYFVPLVCDVLNKLRKEQSPMTYDVT